MVNEAILEDKLVDLWPDYSCPCDVSSQNLKNRDMRDAAMAEIAEKLGENGTYSSQDKNSYESANISSLAILNVEP